MTNKKLDTKVKKLAQEFQYLTKLSPINLMFISVLCYVILSVMNNSFNLLEWEQGAKVIFLIDVWLSLIFIGFEELILKIFAAIAFKIYKSYSTEIKSWKSVIEMLQNDHRAFKTKTSIKLNRASLLIRNLKIENKELKEVNTNKEIL